MNCKHSPQPPRTYSSLAIKLPETPVCNDAKLGAGGQCRIRRATRAAHSQLAVCPPVVQPGCACSRDVGRRRISSALRANASFSTTRLTNGRLRQPRCPRSAKARGTQQCLPDRAPRPPACTPRRPWARALPAALHHANPHSETPVRTVNQSSGIPTTALPAR